MFGNIENLRHECGILIGKVLKLILPETFFEQLPVSLINHYFSGSSNLHTFNTGSDPGWHLKYGDQNSSE